MPGARCGLCRPLPLRWRWGLAASRRCCFCLRFGDSRCSGAVLGPPVRVLALFSGLIGGSRCDAAGFSVGMLYAVRWVPVAGVGVCRGAPASPRGFSLGLGGCGACPVWCRPARSWSPGPCSRSRRGAVWLQVGRGRACRCVHAAGAYVCWRPGLFLQLGLLSLLLVLGYFAVTPAPRSVALRSRRRRWVSRWCSACFRHRVFSLLFLSFSPVLSCVLSLPPARRWRLGVCGCSLASPVCSRGGISGESIGRSLVVRGDLLLQT